MTGKRAVSPVAGQSFGTVVVLWLLSALAFFLSASAGEVRVLQPRGRALLARGVTDSTTFKQSIDVQSDLVVYVDLHPRAAPLRGGSRERVPSSAGELQGTLLRLRGRTGGSLRGRIDSNSIGKGRLEAATLTCRLLTTVNASAPLSGPFGARALR